MTPDPENRAVDSALNGDEPAQASDAPERPEPNGSDAKNGERTQEQETEGAPAEPAEPQDAERQAESETAQPEPAPPPTEEGETLAEPAPDEVASSPRPEPTETVPEPLLKEEPAAPEFPAASEPAAETEPAAEAQAVEEPSGIAADIERALQAAAAEEAAPEPEPEPAAPAAPAAEVAAEAPAAEAEAEPAADAAEATEEDEVVLRAFQPGDWFVVHTYAGYENKVKTNLESRISSMNVEEKIFEVVIPMEDVMEIKSGKKQVVQRKVFPGYLLVRMDLDDDSWYVVRNTPGVTGFVGSGARPIPLSEREVDRILQRKPVGERPKPKLEWAINDPVRVTTGPFANFQGLISEIDTDRSKLKVLVNIFGRETPVELGFDQVAKV
jgi:transcription termination/antitermination protein NusG